MHPKIIQSLTSYFAAAMPRPFVHVGECKLVSQTEKRRPLSNLKDFCLCTDIVGVSTFHNSTPAIFARVNGLELNDTALQGLLGTFSSRRISTVADNVTSTLVLPRSEELICFRTFWSIQAWWINNTIFPLALMGGLILIFIGARMRNSCRCQYWCVFDSTRSPSSSQGVFW